MAKPTALNHATPPHRSSASAQTPRTRRRGVMLLAAGGGGGAVVALGAMVALSRRGDGSGSAATGQAAPVAASGASDYPGADIIAIDKPAVDLGRVPLNVIVPVTVTLTNRSAETIFFGRPKVEAIEGC